MTERPITTDNGWGTKKTFENFEEMFKCFFAERLKGYEFEKLMEKTIKSFVQSIFDQHKDSIQNFIIDEMSKKFEDMKAK